MIKTTKLGVFITLMYILMSYMPQFFYHIFNYENLAVYYKVGKADYIYHFNLIIHVTIFLFFYKKIPITRYKITPIHLKLSNKFIFHFSFSFSLFMVYLAFLFQKNYGAHFRNSGIGFRNVETYVAFLFFFREFIKLWFVFIFMRLIQNKIRINFEIRAFSFVFLLFCLLTTTGSFDVFILVQLSMLIIFNKNEIMNTFFGKNIKPLNLLLLIIALFIILFISVFIGFYNKWGFERTFSYIFDFKGLKNLFHMLMIRSSSHYCSWISILKNHPFDFSMLAKVYQIIFENIVYRLHLIFNMFSVPRPEITSVNRLNHILTAFPFNATAGSSPGILLSGIYLFLYPLGIVFSAAYTSILTKQFSYLINPFYKKTGFIGGIFFISFFLPFFEAPIKFLTIDTTTIYAIGFIFILFFENKKNTK